MKTPQLVISFVIYVYLNIFCYSFTVRSPARQSYNGSRRIVTTATERENQVKFDQFSLRSSIEVCERETREDETSLQLGPALELGINCALRNDPSVLRQILDENCLWNGPLGKHNSLSDIERELRELGQFLADPKFTVTSIDTGDSGQFNVRWIASATWPVPWIPRLIIRGKSSVKLNASRGNMFVSLSDEWDDGLLTSLMKHLLPGFWDTWSQFCSPQAERYPYKVIKRGRGYEIWKIAPRLMVQPSIIDRTNSRQTRMAYVLPSWVFTASINTRGRVPEEYFTTSPVESEISPFVETRIITNDDGTTESVQARVNRITWSIQVPTAFGLDSRTMPDLPGEGFDSCPFNTITYQRQDDRVVAVSNYNGSVQDKEAGILRGKLLAQLKKDGVKLKKSEDGRPKTGFLSFDGKVGWNKQGRVSIAIWEYRPKILGKGNKVFAELEG